MGSKRGVILSVCTFLAVSAVSFSAIGGVRGCQLAEGARTCEMMAGDDVASLEKCLEECEVCAELFPSCASFTFQFSPPGAASNFVLFCTNKCSSTDLQIAPIDESDSVALQKTTKNTDGILKLKVRAETLRRQTLAEDAGDVIESKDDVSKSENDVTAEKTTNVDDVSPSACDEARTVGQKSGAYDACRIRVDRSDYVRSVQPGMSDVARVLMSENFVVKLVPQSDTIFDPTIANVTTKTDATKVDVTESDATRVDVTESDATKVDATLVDELNVGAEASGDLDGGRRQIRELSQSHNDESTNDVEILSVMENEVAVKLVNPKKVRTGTTGTDTNGTEEGRREMMSVESESDAGDAKSDGEAAKVDGEDEKDDGHVIMEGRRAMLTKGDEIVVGSAAKVDGDMMKFDGGEEKIDGGDEKIARGSSTEDRRREMMGVENSDLERVVLSMPESTIPENTTNTKKSTEVEENDKSTESDFSTDATVRPDLNIASSANLTADADRRALISSSVQMNLMSDVAASIDQIASDVNEYTTKSILHPAKIDGQDDVFGDSSDSMLFESVLSGDWLSESDQLQSDQKRDVTNSQMVEKISDDLSDDDFVSSEVGGDAAVQGESTQDSVVQSESDNRRTLRTVVGSSGPQLNLREVLGFLSWVACVLLFASCCVCIRRARTQAVLISQGISPEHGIYRQPYGAPPGAYVAPSGQPQYPPPWAPYPAPQAPPQKAEV